MTQDINNLTCEFCKEATTNINPEYLDRLRHPENEGAAKSGRVFVQCFNCGATWYLKFTYETKSVKRVIPATPDQEAGEDTVNEFFCTVTKEDAKKGEGRPGDTEDIG